MAQGRSSPGIDLVDTLEAPAAQRRRLRVILEQLAGTCTVGTAARRLRLSRSWYCELRTRALAGMLAALQAGAPGRPAQGHATEDPVLCQLRAEHRALEQEVSKLRALLELARQDPGLLSHPPAGRRV